MLLLTATGLFRRALIAAAAIALLIPTSCANQTKAFDRTGAVTIKATLVEGPPSIASGGYVSENQILTVAHSLDGATEIEVTDESGQTQSATIRRISTKLDAAILVVDEHSGSPLDSRFTSPRVGSTGLFVGRDSDGHASEYRIERKAELTIDVGPQAQRVARDGLIVNAVVKEGDSGSLLYDRAGRITGMIFAVSKSQPDVAYATRGDALELFVSDMA